MQYWRAPIGLVSCLENDRVSRTRREMRCLRRHRGAPLHRGAIYTTAALLAEGEAEVEQWHRQGFAAVDMGTATTFAVAEYFGMAHAAILYVFDNPRRREHLLLSEPEKEVRREQANSAARELAFALALELDDGYR